jgi:MFS family permease
VRSETARPSAWRLAWLNADGKKLLVSKVLRSFGYGYLPVILAVFLEQIGLNPVQVGFTLAAAVAGSALMTIFWSLVADRYGRRRTVATMSLLMVAGGLLFAVSNSFWLLLLGAFTGTISATNSEVGAFSAVDQAVLPQTAPPERRTWIFSLYEMLGNFSGAAGALSASAVGLGAALGLSGADLYRPLFVLYALLGAINLFVFLTLSDRVELARVEGARPLTGLRESRGMVARLSVLFGVDGFAGGLIVQSLVAYWFYLRWGLSPEVLGLVSFWVGVLTGLSFLAASWLAQRIGLLNTMVFTHLPSNVLLLLVPLMPTAWLAVLVFLVRMSISQMDVPTRKSYTMAVVSAGERTATAGITNVARSIGTALSPTLSGLAFSVAAFSAPFFVAGALKIAYDLTIYRAFKDVRPPEEVARREVSERAADGTNDRRGPRAK